MWPPICTNFCIFVATTKKLNIVVESVHFPTFFAKQNAKLEREMVMKFKKWSSKSHGKILCQVCGNPEIH